MDFPPNFERPLKRVNSKCRIPRLNGKTTLCRSQSFCLPNTATRNKEFRLRDVFDNEVNDTWSEIFENRSVKTFDSSNSSILSLDTCVKTCHTVNCFEKSKKNTLHCQHNHQHQEEYLTPTQRFRKEISHLKVLLHKSQQDVILKTKEIEQLKNDVQSFHELISKISLQTKELNDCQVASSMSSPMTSDSGNFDLFPENNVDLQEHGNNKCKDVKTDQENSTKVQTELTTTISNLREDLNRANTQISELEMKVFQLEVEQREKETKHRQIYLEMYKKGQEAARFQHADEVMEFAYQAPNRVFVPELLQQLRLTEHELHRMKNLYRVDVYNKQDFSDAEIKLRFLKDAIYYFLTEKDSLLHLRTMENIVGFTEEERKNIDRALSSRKKFFK